MNFGEIKDNVELILIDVPDAISALTGVFVNGAIKSAEDRYNFLAMQKVATFTSTADSHTLGALPSDWKEWRGKPYYVTFSEVTRPMEIVPSLELAGRQFHSNSGTPNSLLIEEPSDGLGTRAFTVWPKANSSSDYSDGLWRISVPYWAYLPELVNDEDENWFTNNMFLYIIFEAASIGFAVNEDHAREQSWKAQAAIKLAEATGANKRAILSAMSGFAFSGNARGPMSDR